MTSVVKPSYSDEQIVAWLRGLLAIAWADGNFNPEEQQFIASLTHGELAARTDLERLQPITATELATALGPESNIRENFLRTAVMVAVADGLYSSREDQVLHQLATALEQKPEALEALRLTLCVPDEADPVNAGEDSESANLLARQRLVAVDPHADTKPDLLHPVRDWLDQLEIQDPRVARFLCKMIPSQCPFERDINLFGHKVVHIPPLCKLNPLYEQLVFLRFRALSYLADDCQEDVSTYC
ncbi:nitrogenase [Neosynechococcus sphagnicola sy1]|uniref:Nitrogenase n=1 Tax=Neosynechococcus sphagnicola sy1 TaxID=1497020 RepID=A0A098TMX6_9CYAN|nr:Mo-dependent nitrogenase C-terminal domain-containing protein [Neosynechococcus sphagnicola]KGF73685.1 nitrogenase [Neosynechococcus sphagnicola sy1]